MGNIMEQHAGPRPPESPVAHVEFNKRFKIEPPRGWLAGLSLNQFKDTYGETFTKRELSKIPLVGSDEYTGGVSINGNLIPREVKKEEQLILPGGTPAIEMTIDPTSGLTLVRSMP